jgi:transposase InsO family protein
MPWTETCTMDERLSFIAAHLRGEAGHSELCRAYGISRKTGYKWLARWREDPGAGLADRSHAPRTCPHALPDAIAGPVLDLRRARPHWGPKKLKAALERRHPDRRWPAASTIGDLLRREGLVAPGGRRRPAPLPGPAPAFAAVEAPHALWCLDFKGWFRTRDGTRCDPLTVTDAYSRTLLACTIVAPTAEGVGPVLEALFARHGLPGALRSDNGPPFACPRAPGGLTRLSAGWLRRGIRLERIAPGRPGQNGRHERLHRTLKAETAMPPAESPALQQARFDAFRRDYNTERPHEALGGATPASRLGAARGRPLLEGEPPEPIYDADHAVRRVRSNGEIKWGGRRVFVSEALAGELVGVTETVDGAWLVRFCALPVGLIDPRTARLRPFASPRPPQRTPVDKPAPVTHPPGPTCHP